MTRFHVHGVVSDLAWELFDDDWFSFDVTEIEEADPVTA